MSATTHVATIYRRSGAAVKNPSGNVRRAEQAVATGVRGTLQMSSGVVVQQGPGRETVAKAVFFAHPREYPNGFTPQPDDVLVVTAGRASETRFEVLQADLVGPGRFEDELLLGTTDRGEVA